MGNAFEQPEMEMTRDEKIRAAAIQAAVTATPKPTDSEMAKRYLRRVISNATIFDDWIRDGNDPDFYKEFL